jgi:uncharacterized membrane protein
MESELSEEKQATRDMNSLVGRVLYTGVLLSVLSLSVGFFWNWMATGKPGLDVAPPHRSIFRFAIEEIAATFREGLRPAGLVNLGILILLFTPYVRVLLSLAYFLLVVRNYKYAAITGFVFGVLTCSLFLR